MAKSEVIGVERHVPYGIRRKVRAAIDYKTNTEPATPKAEVVAAVVPVVEPPKPKVKGRQKKKADDTDKNASLTSLSANVAQNTLGPGDSIEANDSVGITGNVEESVEA